MKLLLLLLLVRFSIKVRYGKSITNEYQKYISFNSTSPPEIFCISQFAKVYPKNFASFSPHYLWVTVLFVVYNFFPFLYQCLTLLMCHTFIPIHQQQIQRTSTKWSFVYQQISFQSEESNPQETPACDYLSFLPDARTIWGVWSRGRFLMLSFL